MKVFAVSACLFLLLLVVAMGNFHYVRGVTARIQSETSRLTFSEESEEVLSSLEAFWESQRPKLSFSVSYRELEDLGEALVSLRAAYETRNVSEFERYRNLVIHAAESIARLESFSVENIF